MQQFSSVQINARTCVTTTTVTIQKIPSSHRSLILAHCSLMIWKPLSVTFIGKEEAEGTGCDGRGVWWTEQRQKQCSCERLEMAFSGGLDTWSHGHFCGLHYKSFEQWTVCHSVINLSMFSVWLSREGLLLLLLLLNGSLVFSDVAFYVFEGTQTRLPG